MNIENYQEIELSPINMDTIDDTIAELATINEFEKLDVDELPKDLVDTIINLNL